MEHGWLTTVRPDGAPRTSRVWFAETADAVWVASAVSNRKIADIRRDPRVTFAVEGRHGVLNSTATLVPVDAEPAVLGLLAERYTGWDAADPAADGPRMFIRVARV